MVKEKGDSKIQGVGELCEKAKRRTWMIRYQLV